MKNIKQKYTNKRAFTIIEMIVVIVLIGILALLANAGFKSITAQSRDSQRNVNVKSIAEALEKYYDKNGEYPGCADMTTSNLGSLSTLLGGVSKDIFIMPDNTSDSNSVICGDSNLINGDQIAYFADQTTACQTGSSCTKFKLKYIEESTDKTITIDSRRGISKNTFSLRGYVSGEQSGRSIVQLPDSSLVVVGQGATGGRPFIIHYSDKGSVLWSKGWGEVGNFDANMANDVMITNDGFIIVIGETTSYSNGSSDSFMVKLNQNGSIVWSKVWGGVNDDYAESVIQSSDGNYIVSGSANGYTNRISYITKMNSSGTRLWSKTYSNMSSLSGLVELSNGNIIAVNSVEDACLVKVNSNGDLLLAKYAEEAGGEDLAYSSITTTSDGGYIIAGYIREFSINKILLQKFDSSDTLQWEKTYNRMSVAGSNSGTRVSVKQTVDSGYLIATTYQSGYYDALLLKVTSTGSVSWSKTYSGLGNDSNPGPDSLGGIIITNNNGIALVGTTYSYMDSVYSYDDLFLLKTESDGTINHCSSPNCKTVSISEVASTINISSFTPTVLSITPTYVSPTATLIDFTFENSFIAR